MELVLDDERRLLEGRPDAQQPPRFGLELQSRELVDSREEDGRGLLVQSLVHDLDRQLLVELTLHVRAVDHQVLAVEPEAVRPRVRRLLTRNLRGAAPRAGLHLKLIRLLRVRCLAQAIQRALGRAPRTRSDIVADPQADREGAHAAHPVVAVLALPSHQLHGAHERGGSLELLRGQEPERVPGQDRRSTAGGAVLQASAEHLDGRQAEVGLRLAAAGREPDEVHELTIDVALVERRGQRNEQETKLEGAPLRLRHELLPDAAGERGLTHLQPHGRHAEGEGRAGSGLLPQEVDPVAHALDGHLAAVDDDPCSGG